ncbi:MAG: hypothetical protein OXM02_10575 [Bacteroidota bacterium]|nr:hypothetical protein [Bacteroidota bacterium]MDE2834949.1 hypothetical protein [Bacteroidota bacterium]MDE2958015.1 hypothetical protein [Bacteroidota bacterium]
MKNFPTREDLCPIVVSFAACFLKIQEHLSDEPKLDLHGQWLIAQKKFVRDGSTGKLSGNSGYVAVEKRAVQAVAQGISLRSREHQSGAFVNKQVKERVVARRNCPPETSLPGTSQLFAGQPARLLE